MKQFQVYDLYDCYGEVKQFDTLEEAKQFVEFWKKAAPGKCDLLIREWDETAQIYRAVQLI